MKRSNYVIKFLEENGFKKMESNSYANDLCNVIINNKDNCYEISDNDGYTIYSPTMQIYWLIRMICQKKRDEER